MKKILSILVTFLSLANVNAQSFGTFASAVFISQNGVKNGFNVTGSGANLIGKIENPFSGNLGSYYQNSGELILNGGEVKTFKGNNANVCSAVMYYSIHMIDSTSAFTPFNLPFKVGCVNNVFADNLGPCNVNDQKWSIESDNIDLTTYIPGTYAIDVYYEVQGNATNTAGCDQTDTIGNNLSLAGTMTFTIMQPLPIEMVSFTGRNANNANILIWKMANETDLARYELEKSADGNHFKSISTFTINPSVKGHYNYVDALPFDGQNLYRIKMVDKNNAFKYSNIITLNDKVNEASVTVTPNPAANFVDVKSSVSENATISLMDLSGRTILTTTTNTIHTRIDVSDLASGPYIITYKSTHSSQRIKIVKQ